MTNLPFGIEGVRTVRDMAEAFSGEEKCRAILESMVWPDGPTCPKCASKGVSALRDREMGGRVRPGLRKCGGCGFQFTVTTRTPMHSTKLPLSVWLSAIWLILQSDKGISSVRLAGLLGTTQKVAWHLGHRIRLMMGPKGLMSGIVEADVLFVGGAPRKDPSNPDGRKGKQGSTEKTPVLVAVERPGSRDPDDPDDGPKAGGRPMGGRSCGDVSDAVEDLVSMEAHLMTDAGGAFAPVGSVMAAHDTVVHSAMEFSRGIVSANGAEGFGDRLRRTVAGVFHHLDGAHLQRYFDEISWRWSQRRQDGTCNRLTRKGRVVSRPVWERVSVVEQMRRLLRRAFGAQGRRTPKGGFTSLCPSGAFGG